jgi:ribosome biogenesis GTPase
MQEGIVLRAYSSYYYVQAERNIYACKLRGRFKKERYSLIVGDHVLFLPQADGTGMIEKILPRQSLLTRPMVANVNKVVLTFAIKNPDINSALVDRFLVLAEHAHLGIIICINKTDLADPQQLHDMMEVYRRIGYRIIVTAAEFGRGIDELKQFLTDNTTVFAGPSGVGKSSLLNAVQPGFALQTGEVSEKIGRGKHTTRYAQLLALDTGGYVVDTPGFSSIEFSGLRPEDLANYFPEIAARAGSCKFSPCLHWKEPQCRVKEAVEQGLINNDRYTHYIQFLAEINERNRGY